MINKKAYIISVGVLIAVLSITIGFAAFSTNLRVTSNASVTPDSSTFSVKFSKVSNSIQEGNNYPVVPISGNGYGAIITNSSNPTIGDLHANFTSVGQSTVYEFYAVNTGEFDAYLTDINFLNIEGKSVTKECTPGANATQSLVNTACQGINIKVNIAGFGDANTNREVKGHKLTKGTSEKITVTISYESGAVDGSFSVDFGNISLTYSSVDSETGDTTGGIIVEGGSGNTGSTTYLCKRATQLHSDSKATYGNLGTLGTLSSGDAFDCDVDGDGDYNSTTERFYYVSDYYDGDTGEFNSDVATLIYYSNTVGATPNNTTAVAYHTDDINYVGPVTAVANLPTTDDWINVNLYKTTRQIRNNKGGTTTSNGSKNIISFSYSSYAARLLTYQEIDVYCNVKDLFSCNYLLENTYYSNSSYKYGYWLETPYASSSFLVWIVDSDLANVGYDNADTSAYIGFRPAIDVVKDDMEI